MNNKKIRIVHIVQSPGGVERYLFSLFKYMNREKYENILLASNDYKGEDFSGLVDSFQIVNMIREIKPQCDIPAIFNIRNLIKKYNPDIVYCHSSKAGAIGRIANLGLNKHCVYNPHGWAFNMRSSKKKQWLYRKIEKILSYMCDLIVCISDAEMKSAINQRICQCDKLQVIYNGIDFDEYLNDRNLVSKIELSIPKSAFVIGMVGRISEQKAPDIFVEAAKIIKNKIPDAFFMIVGDGEDVKSVWNIIHLYGLESSFLITGWVEHPMAYIKKIDIAMLLSRWEGFGLVLPEYMLAQKPIVATNIDAIPYIIKDRDNGLLVNVDDPVMTANAVIELFENEKLRMHLVERGKLIVTERFNAKRVAIETEELFDKMVRTEE